MLLPAVALQRADDKCEECSATLALSCLCAVVVSRVIDISTACFAYTVHLVQNSCCLITYANLTVLGPAGHFLQDCPHSPTISSSYLGTQSHAQSSHLRSAAQAVTVFTWAVQMLMCSCCSSITHAKLCTWRTRTYSFVALMPHFPPPKHQCICVKPQDQFMCGCSRIYMSCGDRPPPGMLCCPQRRRSLQQLLARSVQCARGIMMISGSSIEGR